MRKNIQFFRIIVISFQNIKSSRILDGRKIVTTLSIFIMLLIPIFLMFFLITLKFGMSQKSKDEDEKKILLKSYQYASIVFPIGWLLIEIYYRFIDKISMDIYRDYMVLLIFIMFITQGMSILILKKGKRLLIYNDKSS